MATTIGYIRNRIAVELSRSRLSGHFRPSVGPSGCRSLDALTAGRSAIIIAIVGVSVSWQKDSVSLASPVDRRSVCLMAHARLNTLLLGQLTEWPID